MKKIGKSRRLRVTASPLFCYLLDVKTILHPTIHRERDRYWPDRLSISKIMSVNTEFDFEHVKSQQATWGQGNKETEWFCCGCVDTESTQHRKKTTLLQKETELPMPFSTFVRFGYGHGVNWTLKGLTDTNKETAEIYLLSVGLEGTCGPLRPGKWYPSRKTVLASKPRQWRTHDFLHINGPSHVD
ncbi:hypothetical protein WG66_016204 [Moniliophthora roreri]|nr:hypothetical protein WG66_016204 [Moniliophthora roreri]